MFLDLRGRETNISDQCYCQSLRRRTYPFIKTFPSLDTMISRKQLTQYYATSTRDDGEIADNLSRRSSLGVIAIVDAGNCEERHVGRKKNSRLSAIEKANETT